MRAFRLVYRHSGFGSHIALLLLLASLVGSYLSIPVARLPGAQIISGEAIPFFGMSYEISVVVNWPGTVIAVNVGGAVIPGLLSLYLLARNPALGARRPRYRLIAVVRHALARPVPGLGIALPVFVPPLSAAAVALILSRRHAGALAYIGRSLGTLIGADPLNLDKISGLGAPVAAIGGAGTFDGIFLTGVLAVLIASIFGPSNRPEDQPGIAEPRAWP